MVSEGKAYPETAAEILVEFDARTAAEFERFDEMAWHRDLKLEEAAQLRLQLRPTAQALREALNNEISAFIQDSHTPTSGKSRKEIVVEALKQAESGAEGNVFLRDAIQAIAQAADEAGQALGKLKEEARQALKKQKEENLLLDIFKMLALTLICYGLLFIFDFLSNQAKKSECEAAKAVPLACTSETSKALKATGAIPLAFQSCKSTLVQTETKLFANGQSGKTPTQTCSAWKCADDASDVRNKECEQLTGAGCGLAVTTFKWAIIKPDSVQGVALKSLVLLTNILFVLGLSGFALTILRYAGIRIGDRFIDMLLDGIKDEKKISGKNSGGGSVASGLASLFSAKAFIGAAVAATMGVAAVNSYIHTDKLTNRDQRYDSRTSDVRVETHTTEKETVAPLNPELIAELTKLVGQIKGVAQTTVDCTTTKNCPPAGNTTSIFKLLDEKTAATLGDSFGAGFGNAINAGNGTLKADIAQLKEDKKTLADEVKQTDEKLVMQCIDLMKLEFEVKQDLKTMREKMVTSRFPEYPNYYFRSNNIDCKQILRNKCNNAEASFASYCALLKKNKILAQPPDENSSLNNLESVNQ